MNDEVELAITQLVPSSLEVERRARYLPKAQNVGVESFCPREVGDGDADVVERLDLDHGMIWLLEIHEDLPDPWIELLHWRQ
jgi:hypothetical protein